jgi:hypothetical protein
MNNYILVFGLIGTITALIHADKFALDEWPFWVLAAIGAVFANIFIEFLP